MPIPELTQYEYQQTVFFCKSKTAFQKWTGLESKEFNDLWKKQNLLTPTDFVRGCSLMELLYHVGWYGSYEAAATRWGVSASFLKQEITARKNAPPPHQMEGHTKRFGSIDLTAFILDVTPGEVRAQLKEEGADAKLLITYDHTSHHNAKGRRAEIWWARQRGSHIIRDMNLEEGSQASYDFRDDVFGAVNVKSSREFHYTAKTRRDNAAYWKISASGLEEADYVAAVFTSGNGKEMLGYLMVPAQELRAHGTKTVCFTNEGGNWRISKVSRMPEMSEAD